MQPDDILPCSKGSFLAYKRAHRKGVRDGHFLVREGTREKEKKESYHSAKKKNKRREKEEKGEVSRELGRERERLVFLYCCFFALEKRKGKPP